MKRVKSRSWVGFVLLLAAGVFAYAQQRSQLDEERLDYYQKWLEQDVVYIITDEEREVFRSLLTPEEKESFIEQFWRRRDPAPETMENEFREEHYRRIAYANDHFSIGTLGWKTDRGRIYIIHGEPDSTQYHDQGEQYYRPMTEGGGVTTTYAWQVWHYRQIPGVGSNIEIEFVDKTMTGHFVFARDEMDKDAMLWVPGLGLTESERLGGASRAERIGTRWMANEASRRVGNPLKIFTQKDDLFERLRRYSRLQAAPDIKFRDLEGLVDIQLYYSALPFTVRHDLIRVTPSEFLVPVTFFFDNREFTFEQTGDIRQAKLNIYGRVENLTKQRVYSFDDSIFLTLERDDSSRDRSVYQRSVPLEPGRYKLIAIIKDERSGKIGTLERGIQVPGALDDDHLEVSPIILADRVQPARHEEFITDPFVLGGVKVYPSRDNAFQRGNPVGFYFEVYNVMADQQTFEPSLSLRLRISRDGRELPTPFQGRDLASMLHRYSDRFFAGSMFNSEPLDPGSYTLSIVVTDNIAQREVERDAVFVVADDSGRRAASSR
jgi:GWxTD domain-containing protein